MRTTVRIRDDLLKQAKKKAAEAGCTLTTLFEEALLQVIAKRKSGQVERVELPISQATGGLLPGVDLNRYCDLEEVLNVP